MSLKGEKVYVAKGLNKGFYGTVTHADRDSVRMVLDLRNHSEHGVYDRIDNLVRANRKKK